jgi:hypothetical protein
LSRLKVIPTQFDRIAVFIRHRRSPNQIIHTLSACELLLACKGRVVVTGMGKSGHIGGKIAATLASTGTPAFFVHPGEASHGDLGMITPRTWCWPCPTPARPARSSPSCR